MFETLRCAREWTLRPGSLLRRSLVCLIGVILTAIGITVALKGHAGVDPFTALLQGVSHVTGLSFSWVVPAVNIALIALIFPFDHKVFGLGTVLNFTLVGVLVTSFTGILDSIYVFTYSIPGMLAHLAVGLVIFALGLSLYITPDIGQGAADCIVPVLLRRFPGHSYRTFRVAQDFIVVLIALALFRFDLSSGVIGIGTAIMALGIGVVVDFFNRTVAVTLIGRSPESVRAASDTAREAETLSAPVGAR